MTDPFAAQLVRCRARSGLCQGALAVRAGVDRSTITRLENGSRRPSLAMVDALAGALGFAPGSADEARLYLAARFVPPGVSAERLLLTCVMAGRAT